MEHIETTFNSFLQRRRALVTGGTSGIGAARVEPGFDGEAVRLDVRDKVAVGRLIGGFDRLDVLVNCAGVIRRNAEHDPEVFDDVVDINLNGMMRCCVASRALLEKSAGAIVNTASVLSYFGGGGVPAYSASKGGVAQLTRSLAIAYAADRIRVNAVAPGWIVTPLTPALQQDGSRSRAIFERTPLGRWGQPEDIAGAVVFLCSPAAAFVTGVVLPADGGYLVT